MAVTRVAPRWEGRGGTTDEKGIKTLKRQWTVETDDDATGEPEVVDGVIAFDATAELFAPHPDWAWCICRKLAADPYGGPRVWLVNAEYNNAPFEAKGDGSGSGGNTTSPNPAQTQSTPANERPPTITISRKEVTKPLEKDVVSGDKIVNVPIGDPFDPPPEVFRSHHLITFKFHRTPVQLNWSVRADFMDSINNAVFTILGKAYPAFSLRCVDYSLDTVWDTGEAGLELFFVLTVQLEYDPDLWKISILNTGRRKRVGGSIGDPDNPARVVAIVDDNGQPVAEPVPLTLLGQPVEPGGAYHYVDADGYIPKNWATLLV